LDRRSRMSLWIALVRLNSSQLEMFADRPVINA